MEPINPNHLCADGDCKEYGYHERKIMDLDTPKFYYIYLCEEHTKEFDSFHAILRISK